MAINLYDFDHTIYDGDASLDFILYCMRRQPKLWKHLPSQGIALMGYVAGMKTRKQIKQVAFRFLRDIDNLDGVLESFWATHSKKIQPWYEDQKRSTDIIASASPEFLLQPMIEALGVKRFVGTRMDTKTGQITGENCRAEEKVRRLEEFQPLGVITGTYSDSLSDKPIFDLAKNAYVVKKGKVMPHEAYRPSVISRLKSPEFIRFLFVGGLNALLGIAFAYMVSLFVEDGVIAFVIGYSISLIPSYFLNSIITFKDFKFSLKKFGKFVLSYIPNFIVQFVSVNVFIKMLGVSPLLTYIVSVIIAVPVTFLLLSFFTFAKKK